MSQIVDIKLSRFENSPWGFRLHGGTDFGTPLLIQKVNISSLSESAGLQPGDIVVKVNGENVENLRHKEVQEKIVRAGNNFNLTVNRGGVLSQALKPAPVAPQSSIPRPNPEGREWKSSLEADAAGSADNAEEFTRQFMAQLKGDIPPVLPSPGKQNGNFRRELSSTPVHQTVPNGGTQYTGVQHSTLQNKSRTQTPVQNPKNLMNRQYNSPQALYSEDNIQEVLSQQAEVLSNGVKGIDFNQYKKAEPKLPHQSAVLKYLRECEQEAGQKNGGVANMSSHQENRNYSSTRMCPSPVSTLNRRHDFPAGNPRLASPSPAYSRNIQGSQVQTQGRINVEGTDDIVTTSCKPKKEMNNITSQPHKPQSSDLDELRQQGIIKSLSSYRKMTRKEDDTDAAPVCAKCLSKIERGPFITAMGKTWCPAHFLCGMENCRKSLQEVGFVEEKGLLYCEDCYARYLAPDCEKCRKKIVGNCLKAMGKNFHPDCFCCAYCGVQFANSPFYLEDGLPYCETDWNELFTTKCVSCGFPIEAGDRWVEALNNNYHSQCFNCTLCKKNLEGQSFFVKSGKPFCKGHATRM